jgi:hypothetical protein
MMKVRSLMHLERVKIILPSAAIQILVFLSLSYSRHVLSFPNLPQAYQECQADRADPERAKSKEPERASGLSS